VTVELLVDADVHIIEPRDTWTERMSKKRWGDLVPHVRYDAEMGGEYWFAGDTRLASVGHTCVTKDAAGQPTRVHGYDLPKVYDDIHPSAYDSAARLKVMDEWGINAAVLYPDVGLFVTPRIHSGGQAGHVGFGMHTPTTSAAIDNVAEYRRELVLAYNDFVADWISLDPSRYVALVSIPYWDVPAAVAEIERCAPLGFRGVITTGAPQVHGQPHLADRHWDPIWAAARDHGMSVSFHVGGGDISAHSNPERRAVMGALPMGVRAATSVFFDNAHVLGDLLMSGILARFPDLEFVNVESGIGWIAFCLESLDYHFKQYDVFKAHPEFDMLPSEYFQRQVYCTYWFEDVTDNDLERVGADRILFETDFPHPTCLLGDAIGEALTGLDGVSAEYRDKILYGNAEKLYGLSLNKQTSQASK
jgi:predicted TIM-barrel fold metal-dependent hydrolase